MQKDDAVRIRHMLDAAREAKGFAIGKARPDLDTDRMLVLALVKEEIPILITLLEQATAHT